MTKANVTKERKPQHKWLSAAKLAKFYAISLSKAKDILHTNGLANFNGTPTKVSLDAELVEARPSPYNEGEFYYVWCFEKVKSYFTEPSPEQEAVFFTSRRQADAKVMAAIEALGKMNNIFMSKYGHGENGKNHIPKDCPLDPHTIAAVVQCHFSDPHFYGTFAFEYASSRDDVKQIFECIWPVVNDLTAHLPANK